MQRIHQSDFMAMAWMHCLWFLLAQAVLLRLGVDGQSDKCDFFKEHHCTCSDHVIRCDRNSSQSSTPLEAFPTGENFETVQTLLIVNARFKILNSSHLQQFPNLLELYLTSSSLEVITDDALSEIPLVKKLKLNNNRLVSFPHIAGLMKLISVELQGNRIGAIDYQQVKQCPALEELNINHNNIKVLRNGTFRDSCKLSELRVSHNEDLSLIEDYFFDGLSISELDCSYTNIRKLPTNGLMRLKILNLEGSKRLHDFPSATGQYNPQLCMNKTFPFLKSLRFEYHAHCCLYTDFRPLIPRTGPIPTSTGQCPGNITNTERSASSPRRARSTESYVCIHLSNGSLFNNFNPEENQIYQIEELCELIPHCFQNQCPENCAEGSGESGVMEGIACVEKTSLASTISASPLKSMTSSINPTSVSSTLPVKTSTTMYQTMPSPSVVASLTVTTVVCWKGQTILPSIGTKSSLSVTPTPASQQTFCTTLELSLSPSTVKDVVCSLTTYSTATPVTEIPPQCSTIERLVAPSLSFSLICPNNTLSSSTSTSASPSSPSSSSPSPTPPPPIIDCDYYEGSIEEEDCVFCTLSNCDSEEVSDMQGYDVDCDKYLSICDPIRRRRSVDCLASGCISNMCNEFEHLCQANRYKRNMAAASSCNVSVIVVEPSLSATQSNAIDSTTTEQISTTSMVISTPNPSPIIQSSCSHVPLLDAIAYVESENYTSCYPGNDPFNPCFHILDDDILRGAIWLVVIIAIGGNVLVIVVTLLHWIRRYRSYRKEPNLLYVLYLNLAVADLFMGFYLITIAITDIQTKGHYSTQAIDWQTSSECFFAGFCAIFSSILSIYTLLVITLERVYSIKFALENKHFKKHWVFLIMIFGWAIAILFGLLPKAGLSSYDRVSICLPFENRGEEDKAYIAIILILTGLASLGILLSYVYLFYIVGCSANKRLLTRSLSGKEELKLALRMSLLVLTDFATWAPIAFFGLTATFGYPIVDIKAAKVLIVFVFPLNSCLNPILYSFSTRLFRNNMLGLLKKCGMCKLCDQYSKSVQTSSFNRNTSSDLPKDGAQGGGYHGRRRSTQISILSRLASISSLGSDSAGSRRGSTFSGSSLEEGTTFRNNVTPDIDRGHISNGIIHRSMKDHRNSTGSLPGLTHNGLKVVIEEDETENKCIVDTRRKYSNESDSSTCVHYVNTVNYDGISKNGELAGRDSFIPMRRQSLPTILDSQEDSQTFQTMDVSALNKKTNNRNTNIGVVLMNFTASNGEDEIQQAEISFM